MEKLLKDFINQMNNRLDSIDKKFENIDKRFEDMDKKFESIDKRFDSIDKQFESIDKRFDLVDTQFKEHGQILRGLEEKTTILVSDVDHIKHDIIEMKDNFVTKKSLLKVIQ